MLARNRPAHIYAQELEAGAAMYLDVRRQLSVAATAPISDRNLAQEHTLDSTTVRLRVKCMRRIAGVAREVHL